MNVEIVYKRPSPPQPHTVQYYMQREDKEVFGSIRSCAPCPAVFVMKDDPHARISQQWQYYLYAINYNMTVENVFLILDQALAFANKTGFRHGNIKADYFHNKDLNAPLPSFDKVRTTSRSVVTGTERFSLIQAFKETSAMMIQMKSRQTSFRGVQHAFSNLLKEQNVLDVWTFDSREPPPLKPGKSYPKSIEQVNPGDYLYLPQFDREKFLVANIVNARGEVVQFPRGALYDWIDGGRTPYTFVPHISNHGYGPISYPMSRLLKIPFGSPPPRAYRSN